VRLVERAAPSLEADVAAHDRLHGVDRLGLVEGDTEAVEHAGGRRGTVVAISLRLFIPSQQPSLTPPGTL
jgi:hypothetical protein